MNTQDEGTVIGRILRDCKNPVILDLGAYGGEDTAWLVGACSVPPLCIAVEADIDNFNRLTAAKLPAVTIFGAISDTIGTCTFFACDTGQGRGSGSIRRPTGHLQKGETKYDFREVRNVPCYTLDSIFDLYRLSHIDLIWCDIQAAEPDMISGGQKALARTRYLFIEAEDDTTPEMYKGQLNRTALMDLLSGWTEVQRFDFNTLLRNDHYK